MSPTAQTRRLETERRSAPVVTPRGPASTSPATRSSPASRGARPTASSRWVPAIRRAVGQHRHHPGLGGRAVRLQLLDPGHRLGPPRSVDAIGQQGGAQPLDQLLVLPRRDARRRFDHRHQAAEPGMRLGHLEPDRPAAEDQQVAGRLRQVEQRLVGQPGHAVEPRQVGHHRAAAGGDDGAAEGQPAAAGLDLVRAR